MIEPINTKHTYELCPHCEEEVRLNAELAVQVCPNCGMYIVPCSMCLNLNEDIEDEDCENCHLCKQAEDMNRGRTPKEKEKIKRVYRFWSKHWVDIEVEGVDEEDCLNKADDAYNCGAYEDADEHWENTDMEDVTKEYYE